MNWPTDTLAGIFLFLFAFGLIFSVVSLLLGTAHGHLHLPDGGHHGHVGHVGHGQAAHGPQAGHAPQAAHGPGAERAAGGGHAGDYPIPSPVNVSTIMIFLTWFGAAGYIVRVYYSTLPALSLLIAAMWGLIGATLVYLFLARVLWRGQTSLDPANYYVAGAVARVSAPIRAGGTGEIVYTLDGKRRVDWARAVDGGALALGAEVVIARYEGGIAYVQPWTGSAEEEPFIGQPVEPAPAPRAR